MRIDKFLSTVNVVKKRSISEDMCKSGVVFINDIKVKASKDVKISDIITLKYLENEQKFEVLDIPTSKSVSKKDKDKFVKEI